jgi:hypothetical protein
VSRFDALCARRHDGIQAGDTVRGDEVCGAKRSSA